jgi:CheY-like chemotaxis protein
MSINDLIGTGPARTYQTRILLVDDNVALLEAVGDHLELKGAIVDRATSGTEAIELLTKSTYAKVVCDSELLNGEYGPQLVSEFKKLHQGEIIGTSSNPDPQIPKDWQDGGAIFHPKPMGLVTMSDYAGVILSSSEPSLVKHYSR